MEKKKLKLVPKKKVRLVSSRGFLQSVRDLGLTTIDAVNELVDNSFDADANNVHITVEKNGKGNLTIIVEDDGNGIPETMKVHGRLYDGISYALSFGGRRMEQSDRVLTGKFGWGLSSAISCQTTRAEIFTKTKDEHNHRFNYIDFDELEASEDLSLPNTIRKEPDKYKLKMNGNERGTVVVLKNCDNLDYKTPNKMISHLVRDLSETHRKFISSGKKIYIGGKELIPYDPLMLIPGCKDSDVLGIGKEYAEIEPIIVSEDIKDEDGKPAEVRIKISMLDTKKIRGDPEWGIGFSRKYGIKEDNQGFYLVRHNRQIDRSLTLGLFTRHPSYNYFRAEISFPPALDKYFGIQTNKSRFTLKDALKGKIEESMKGIIRQIAKDTDEIIEKIKEEQQKGEIKPSEKVAAKASKFLQMKKVSKKELKKYEVEKKKQETGEIQKVEQDETLSEVEKKKKIEKIKNKFQFERPFQLVLKTIGTGEFYKVKHKGKNTEVVLNVAHPFYTKVYERATQNPELQIGLDLLLFSLAHGEHLHSDKDEVIDFYTKQRRVWSASLMTFIEEM